MTKLFQARAWERLTEQMKTLAPQDEKYAEIQKLMWEISGEEFKKPQKAEEVVGVLTDFVNSSSSNQEKFVWSMTHQSHKTLQQDTFKLFIKCVEEWAKMSNDDYLDPRNEATIKESENIIHALKLFR